MSNAPTPAVVSLSASGGRLALARGRSLRTYVLGKGVPKADAPLEEEADVTAVALSPRGEYVLSGTAGGAVSLWETGRKGGPVFRFRCHDAATRGLAWDASESFFASWGDDGTVRLHAIDGVKKGGFQSKTGIRALAFVLGGCLIAGDDEGQLWFWPPFDDQPLVQRRVAGPIVALEGSAEGPLTAAATASGELHLWGLEGLAHGRAHTLSLPEPVKRLRFTLADGLLTAASGRGLELVTLRPTLRAQPRVELSFPVDDVAQRVDGSHVAVGLDGRAAYVQDGESRSELLLP